MKILVRILIIVLVVLLWRVFFRLIPGVFAMLVRLWYITIPVLLILWFYIRQRTREQVKKNRRDNLDPDKEIVVDQDKQD